MATNGHFGQSGQSKLSENSPNEFPIPKNLGIDTKIKSVACSEPKLQIWPFYLMATNPKTAITPKWMFWPLRSIWGVWKWSQSISHAQNPWDRHQNQVSSSFFGLIPPWPPKSAQCEIFLFIFISSQWPYLTNPHIFSDAPVVDWRCSSENLDWNGPKKPRVPPSTPPKKFRRAFWSFDAAFSRKPLNFFRQKIQSYKGYNLKDSNQLLFGHVYNK